jgi:thiamine kinase-like enzyme
VTVREPLLDKIITENIEEIRKTVLPAKEVIHGDAKLGNMIFRNGKVVGLIDLDTFMCGSFFDDIADCMRSSCLSDNLILLKDRADLFLRGLEDGADIRVTADDKELILANLRRNCFMLGLRYYTDHLTGNKYFTEAHPGDNIERSYRLLQSIQRTI